MGAVPAELAEVCGADDIAFLHGRGGAAVGIPLQGSARAVAILGVDALDADEGGGLAWRFASKQLLVEGERLVVRHRQRITHAGVVRRIRRFIDADGLRLNAIKGFPVVIQRHEAEAAAFVSHAHPDQLAEVLGRDGLADRDRRRATLTPTFQ